MTKITPEIEALEHEKTYFTHMTKLHDLKIRKIKTEESLRALDEEIEKTQKSIDKLGGLRDG